MELSCALLTGFFLWLLIFHWRRKAIARVRDRAGDLVRTANGDRPRRLPWAWFVCLFFLLIPWITDFFAGRQTLGSEFSLALWFSVILLLGIPARANSVLEVRQQGVLCGKANDRYQTRPFVFTPWSQIATYQWVPKSFGSIGRLDDTHGRFTIAEDAIAPEQKADITTAIGRFVPVYDHDGALLAKPDEEQGKKKPARRDLDVPRFQFDLQTMLLLVVVVACAANLCGIRYRSPQYRALGKLETLGPRIRYTGDNVWRLDFSGCVKKPTDADLANLEPLVELETLDLTGAPITDAGLAHLRGLKNLQSVNVTNTRVTSEGMIDLGRALPHAHIYRSFPLPAIAAPPANGKAHP